MEVVRIHSTVSEHGVLSGLSFCPSPHSFPYLSSVPDTSADYPSPRHPAPVLQPGGTTPGYLTGRLRGDGF